jgi:molybdopterin-guanine dinucleotide biosynthesis protein A
MSDFAVGAVLAGGLSRRLGRDKATVAFGERTLLERAISVLSAVFSRTVVSVGANTTVTTGAPVLRDRRPDSGPVGALETILLSEEGRPVFMLACDLPFVEETVIRRILDAGSGRPAGGAARAWIAHASGRDQPLCGLYTSECVGAVQSNLDSGRLSFRDVLVQIAVERVEVGDLGVDVLLNVNSPADLARARRRLYAG